MDSNSGTIVFSVGNGLVDNTSDVSMWNVNVEVSLVDNKVILAGLDQDITKNPQFHEILFLPP